ncbi:hypothetical protein MIV089L [Invertebrate iridescent virus 3]|uniref:Uncharacterized protein 089L n=1 Tax=Invertebrate iridescent virus 3 TaxID=345201 RepID=089L_IIV3|nr:hypothetical protein MIV089L [Invertebrate iridescent virus 3]Q196X1.1 RecName: Full=Uncharacterized protein 089L [Invertebrate iridescent virus 3]ABF82119.1 hypothetical protein MIV089L [Invertebrate iridescent virus 3]
MPRDKKLVHRATSDVEDEDNDQREEEWSDNDQPSTKDDTAAPTETGLEPSSASNGHSQPAIVAALEQERRQHLESIILKRTLYLQQQRQKQQEGTNRP